MPSSSAARPHALQTGNRAHPDGSIAGFQNRFDARCAAAALQMKLLAVLAVTRAVTQSNAQQRRSTHPQVAGAVLVDGMYGERGDAAVSIDAAQAVAFHAKQSVVGAHPKRAVAIFAHGAHKFVGQSLAGRVRAKNAVVVAQQTHPVGACPQAAVATGGKAKDGSNPQIVVGSLRECLDGILRQAVLHLPDTARVTIRQFPRNRSGKRKKHRKQQPGYPW